MGAAFKPSRTGGGRSRSLERERLLAAASQRYVPSSVDVCVIGGGAAGLAAAIAAAEAGASVVVLERALECGRSILATGNGRCNLANAELSSAAYNQPEFVGEAWGEDPLGDVLSFFEESGLAWCLEDGRYYPQSKVAASVRDVLVARAAAAGVMLAPAREATAIASHHGRILVRFDRLFSGEDTRTVSCATVVLSTGGGEHRMASELGVKVTGTRPVLCPLACEDSPLFELDGRRSPATALVERDGRPIAAESGEVLFRSYGLSGILVFDLSRVARPGDRILVDLTPDLAEGELEERVSRLAERRGGASAGLLAGFVDPEIASVVWRLASEGWPGAPAPQGDEETTRAACGLVRGLPFVVTGPGDVAHAQVTRGGMATAAFVPSSLESRDVPGLFACGEALDVDGPCGGFNLAWAWTSGLLAGRSAALAARGRRAGLGKPSGASA
jgi:predicted Rossmann fold flavoprotein